MMVEFVLFKVGDELRELPKAYVHALRQAWRTEHWHRLWVDRWGRFDWLYQYLEHVTDPAIDAAYATWLAVYGLD